MVRPGGFGQAEDGGGPFGGDERLVVGADQDAGPQTDGFVDELLGSGRNRADARDVFAQSLRGDPVLAVGAVQVATQHAEAIGQSAAEGVKERLLFDGIALDAADVAPGSVELAAAVEADLADARVALGDGAAMAAGETADAVAVELLCELGRCFGDLLVEDLLESGHRDSTTPPGGKRPRSRRTIQC